MTVYNLLMAFGVVVVAAVIVNSLSAIRVKPIEQFDNWSPPDGN
jgi:hypothetical protein